MNPFPRVSLFASLAGAIVTSSAASAQVPTVDAAERAAAIEGVATQVENAYVFADVGREMAAAVRGRAERGEYEAISEGPELARLLTEHLRGVSRDLHVAVRFSPHPLPAAPEGRPAESTADRERFRGELARDNYGFRRIEVLPGNVGYLRFDLFAPPEFAAETYAAAMAFVANTDALIIDLRENGGSLSPDAIPMLATYFFEQPTHLIDLKWNTEANTRQLWTWAHVPGRRYLDKPVYILTSRRTFSGAEEFAYDLKNLGRATIVGDTTGGGANPGGSRRASDHFEIFVPFGRVTSPVTGTNWEGVGVAPDISVGAGKALLTAQLEAVRTLREGAADDRRKAALAQVEKELAAKLAGFRHVQFTLDGHPQAQEVFIAGDFNAWAPRSTPMVRSGGGWTAQVELEPGRQPYKLIVDGEWMLDPANPETEAHGEFVNSIRTVP